MAAQVMTLSDVVLDYEVKTNRFFKFYTLLIATGDYGGPLYLLSADGATRLVVGLASFSSDARPVTPCRDGHSTTHTQVAFFSDWIKTNAV